MTYILKNVSLQRVRIHVLLKILLPVESLVTVITLDVLGSCMNDHMRLDVGFLGKGLSTHTASEVLLTFRMRLDQIITKKHPFPRQMMGWQNFLAAQT